MRFGVHSKVVEQVKIASKMSRTNMNQRVEDFCSVNEIKSITFVVAKTANRDVLNNVYLQKLKRVYINIY